MGNVAKYIEDHKMNINYCEVIIDRYGNVWDAQPSHQDWLVNYYCDKYRITREQFLGSIPIYCNPTYYLVDQLGFISVWYDYIVKPEECTGAQRTALYELQEAGQIAEICNVIVSREKQHCDYEDKIHNKENGYSYEDIPITDSQYILIDGKFRRKKDINGY